MNQAADYNFTKASECAILAAGPRAVLAERRVTNYIITAPDKQNFNPTNTFWKPLELHQWIIKAIATKGSTIIDPFAGSGSIPLAAIQLGHNTIAIEKDERHYLDMRRILNV
jgi:DNA modification methylase